MNTAEPAPPWRALRVRSNFEWKSAEALKQRGFEIFLPSYQVRRQWSDRVKLIDRALFSGYLFCRFAHPRDWLAVARTPGIVQIVASVAGPEAVDESEIASLKKLVESGVPLFPRAFMRVGQKIRVERGPLAGAEGILEKFQKGQRIVASISLLQRSVAAEIDADWVVSLK